MIVTGSTSSSFASRKDFRAAASVASFCVVAILMTFVVPKVTKLIEGQGKKLPLPTQILVATSHFLTLAFTELGLHSVNTWTVEHNPSQRGVVRLGFRLVGRQRQCHFIDGKPYDRLLFDLLASEHREITHPGRAAAQTREQPLAASSGQ